MNQYPPEWDTLEEEQPVIETEYQPTQEPPRPVRPAPPPRSRQAPSRRSGGGMNWLALAISILALILAGTALFLALKPEPEPEEPPDISEEEPVTFRFGDREMTPLEGMPLNPYDRAGFATDEKGRVTYERDGRRARAGIDVSTYQKEIDWQAVADDGIEFAILRLGYRGYTRPSRPTSGGRWTPGWMWESTSFLRPSPPGKQRRRPTTSSAPLRGMISPTPSPSTGSPFPREITPAPMGWTTRL